MPNERQTSFLFGFSDKDMKKSRKKKNNAHLTLVHSNEDFYEVPQSPSSDAQWEKEFFESWRKTPAGILFSTNKK